MTALTTLISGQSYEDFDAGYYKPATLGNYVWEDINGDGIQNEFATGIENVVVNLTGTDGAGRTVDRVVRTDENGIYFFDGLRPGEYKVTFETPTDHKATYADLGGDDTKDSDADQVTGMTPTTTLVSGDNYEDFDAGFYVPSRLGDFVWDDLNANGIQDLGEPGISGVLVTLSGNDGAGNPVTLTTTTDGNGAYFFENLVPGIYKITFETPTDYTATAQSLGFDPKKDSDINPATGMTINYTIISGTKNLDIDAGYYKYGEIGNFAWKDCSKDGIQDAGEAGLANVPVVLNGTTGAGQGVNLTTSTDANGAYIFTNLVPGTYRITFGFPVSPTGMNRSPQDQGGNDSRDSDPNASGAVENIIITSGLKLDDIDAGYMDIVPPTLIGVPSGIEVECDEIPEPPVIYVDITATDNWDDNVEITFNEESDQGQGNECTNYNYTITRTWTATDDCGNSISQVQTIAVRDTKAPTFTGVPANATVECSEVPDRVDPSIEDNCDPNPTLEFNELRTDGVCEDSYTLTRTWTTTDACGNERKATQVITVLDRTKPTFTFVPSNVTVECSEVPEAGTPTAEDNCDLDVVISFGEVRQDGACEDSYTLVRTWTATDNCGNTQTASQVITVLDRTKPTFTFVPSNVTVECSEVPEPGTPTAEDNCDLDVVISFGEVRQDGACEDSYTLVRTWTATDNCGNTQTASQVITVLDRTKPTFTFVPSNVTVECSEVPEPGVPTAEDNCDLDVAISFGEVRQDGACEDSYTLVRTWTATDNCGNTQTASQVITVLDRTKPTFTFVPSNVTVECSEVPEPGVPTAEDNCDLDVAISFGEVRQDGACEDSYTLVRTWTATDNCGNTQTASQVITVLDRTKPVLAGVPSNTTVECDEVPEPATVTATDNCDLDVVISFGEVRQDGACEDSYTLIRTWTAADNCGNTQTATQVITVLDRTKPTFTFVPSNVTVECSEVPEPGTPTAEDNCDLDVAISFAEVRQDGACEDSYTLVRTWTATDNCGNTQTASQVITVLDRTEPSFTFVPSNVTVECSEVPDPGTPTAEDNCDLDAAISFAEVRQDGDCEDSYTLIRTWTATDNCGNTQTATQVITVLDRTKPSFTFVPSNVTVECSEVPQPGTSIAEDNCDLDVEIEFAERREDGSCGDSYTLIRTWTATDNCGNTQTASQVITVLDRTKPTFTFVPSNVTVECSEVPEPGTATAEDNCDLDVVISFGEVRQDGACEDSYTLVRTWTATDNCGNTQTASQVITVLDRTKPVLAGVPANATVECNEVPEPTTVTASDNCDLDVQVEFAERREDLNCDENYTLIRTWTATDNCGNVQTETQVITVLDRTKPNFTFVPSNVTVECSEIPEPGTPAAEDNCDLDVEIEFAERREDGSCDDSYTLIRTWTATDNCGNAETATQVITVLDRTKPSFTFVPSNVTVECSEVPEPGNPTAEDNCDLDVNITFAEVRQDGTCENSYILIRTWTATDNCGNTQAASQVITVQDTTSPELQGVPSDATVECDEVPTPALVTAEDNCDAQIEVQFSEVREDGICEDSYTLTRTWIATDDCGNNTSAQQVIKVQDTTKPSLVGVPADAVVECDEVPEVPTVTATDNCDLDVAVEFSEVRENGTCDAAYTLRRTWIATDNCGNTSAQTQEIKVQDTTNPSLVGVPADASVECSEVPNAPTVTATDNCDGDVQVEFNEVREDGECEDSYKLIRTWTAIDDCGNQDVQSQTITVSDNTNPTFVNVPTNITVNCDEVPEAVDVEATDNCDLDVEVIFIERRVNGPCPDTYTILRQWTAVDNCGNAKIESQTIKVQDVTAPVASNIPADVTVECNEVPAVQDPIFEDASDLDVQVAFSEVRENGSCEEDLYAYQKVASH